MRGRMLAIALAAGVALSGVLLAPPATAGVGHDVHAARVATRHFQTPAPAIKQGFGLVRRFWREPPGPAFNALLAQTAKFQVMFAALLCVALVLG